jgi:hypothetical protein
MSVTPSVLLNEYQIDGVSGTVPVISTIASGTFSGVNEDKYIYNIIVDPYEHHTSSGATHSFIFDVSAPDNDPAWYMAPITAGHASGSTYRLVNFDTKNNWLSGVSQIQVDITLSGTSSGAIELITPDSGTSWTPPFGSSGSVVVDVPTIWGGSMIVGVSGVNYSGVDVSGRPHNFQMIQMHVGHMVEVAAWTNVQSGTFDNNDIVVQRGGAGDLYMQFKTYHEHAGQWEWLYSGTLYQSGTHSGSVVENTYNLTDNLQMIDPDIGEVWQLKLYAVGNIPYASGAVRTINVEVGVTFIYQEQGVFGFGGFGVANFGLDEIP